MEYWTLVVSKVGVASVLDHNMHPFSVQTVGSHWVLYLSVDLSLQVDGYLVSSSSILLPLLLNLKIIAGA